MTPWTFLGVFFAAAVFDAVYTCWMRAAATGQSLAAGGLSVLVYLVGLIGSASVIKYSFWYALPECLGLFVGSVVGTEMTRDLD